MSEATTVTRLTPPGTGAIATLAVRGPRAWELARSLFTKAKGDLPEVPEEGAFWFGTLGDERTTDEVVLCYRRREPEPVVEVHCHGGVRVVEWLTGLFESNAESLAPASGPRERAGSLKADIESAALDQLTRARTTRTADIAATQLDGQFADAVNAVLESDDPDQARPRLEELARFAHVGRHLTDPWKVVIAGPPNVGKSTLLNAVHGYQRAIVSDTPGTTRDAVSSFVAVGGWPVELSDTAGLRDGGERLETLGIERTRELLALADLCVWVCDASEGEPELPDESLSGERILLVRNKADLHAKHTIPDALEVSAKSGDGIPSLLTAIASRLVPDDPPPGALMPPGSVWADRVTAALACLDQGDFSGAKNALSGA